MRDVGRSLFPRTNCIMIRRRAVSETFDLWKNEPDPMRLFPATAEFIQDRWVNQVLGRDKPFQVEAVRWRVWKRHRGTALPWTLSTSRSMAAFLLDRLMATHVGFSDFPYCLWPVLRGPRQ